MIFTLFVLTLHHRDGISHRIHPIRPASPGCRRNKEKSSTMDINQFFDLYQQHPCITTDSRHCPVGSIFIALKGESFDGNRFAASALKKRMQLRHRRRSAVCHRQSIHPCRRHARHLQRTGPSAPSAVQHPGSGESREPTGKPPPRN